MEFRFTNEFALSRLDEAVSFLLGPRLWIPRGDYPDFLSWAEKTHGELRREDKHAMVVFRGTDIVGLTVYQQHKKLPDTLEIKNLTVRPDVRGRNIASFLMRNTEIEGMREFQSSYAVCDAKASNLPVRYFLTKRGYCIIDQHDLYQLHSGDDLVYRKRLMSPSIA